MPFYDIRAFIQLLQFMTDQDQRTIGFCTYRDCIRYNQEGSDCLPVKRCCGNVRIQTILARMKLELEILHLPFLNIKCMALLIPGKRYQISRVPVFKCRMLRLREIGITLQVEANYLHPETDF